METNQRARAYEEHESIKPPEDIGTKVTNLIIEGISRIPQANLGIDICVLEYILPALQNGEITLSEFAAIPAAKFAPRLMRAMNTFHSQNGIPAASPDKIEDVIGKIRETYGCVSECELQPQSVDSSRMEAFITQSQRSVLKFIARCEQIFNGHNLKDHLNSLDKCDPNINLTAVVHALDALTPNLKNSPALPILAQALSSMATDLREGECKDISQKYKAVLNNLRNGKFSPLHQEHYEKVYHYRGMLKYKLRKDLREIFVETIQAAGTTMNIDMKEIRVLSSNFS